MSDDATPRLEGRSILFDLDGTLTNPARGITECIRYALAEMAEPPPAEPLERFIGPPLDETFHHLLAQPDESRVRRAIEHYRTRFRDTGLFENELYPGIPEVLASLTEAGADLYVATAKPHVFANRIIDHFGLRPFFRGVYGPELSGLRNDKAELIRHLFLEEGLDGASWMIGDRKHDIEAARANGVPAVGVLWGFGSREELTAAGADHVVERVDELPRLLLSKATQ